MTDRKTIFTGIYQTNRWGSSESVSGRGSELVQTVEVRAAVKRIIGQYSIKHIVDAPCGDFNWMPDVLTEHPEVTYEGFDIVDQIIAALKSRYNDHPRWKFTAKDITTGELPCADLIVNRDCLVHISSNEGVLALANFVSSGSHYLLSTHYPHQEKNVDTMDGHWRPVNLQLPPYSLPNPIELIDVDYQDGGRNHPGNHMGLWDLRAL